MKKSRFSFLAPLLGLLLFFLSLGILYWNETRMNLSQLAASAMEVPATDVISSAEGKLVSITGVVTTTESLGDGLFLKPGNYAVLQRQVEMFSWVETSSTDEGGTKYSYSRQWRQTPPNSSSFRQSSRHHNPPKTLPDLEIFVKDARVGIYRLDLKDIQFSRLETVPLHGQTIALKPEFGLEDGYIFKSYGKYSTQRNPEIGDIRVSYQALPVGTKVTVFGKLVNKKFLVPYEYSQNHFFYHLFLDDRPTAIHQLDHEHRIFTWCFRLLGFLLLWGGMAFSFSPMLHFLKWVPMEEKVSKRKMIFSSLLAALILAPLTIGIASKLNHPIALFVAILVGLASYGIMKKLSYQSA